MEKLESVDKDKVFKKAESSENPLSLEDLFRQLEEVILELEGEETTLEQSFLFYQKGMNLVKTATETIDMVEKKVLVLDESGATHEF